MKLIPCTKFFFCMIVVFMDSGDLLTDEALLIFSIICLINVLFCIVF